MSRWAVESVKKKMKTNQTIGKAMTSELKSSSSVGNSAAESRCTFNSGQTAFFSPDKNGGGGILENLF